MTCPRHIAQKWQREKLRPLLTPELVLSLARPLGPGRVAYLERPTGLSLQRTNHGSRRSAEPRVRRPRFQSSQCPKEPRGFGHVTDSPWTLEASPSSEEGRSISSGCQDHRGEESKTSQFNQKDCYDRLAMSVKGTE